MTIFIQILIFSFTLDFFFHGVKERYEIAALNKIAVALLCIAYFMGIK